MMLNIGCKALFNLVELIEFNVRFKPTLKAFEGSFDRDKLKGT